MNRRSETSKLQKLLGEKRPYCANLGVSVVWVRFCPKQP